MACTLVYSDAMARYNLSPDHPLKPERFTLAVDLMRAYGLLESEGGPVAVAQSVEPATEDELLLFHAPEYIEVVREASANPGRFTWRTRHGIGPGDTPAAEGLHEAASLVVGGTTAALRLVLEGWSRGADGSGAADGGGAAGAASAGGALRTFAPAGGLHHAHRDRAAGFCVYNDAAIAIEIAVREHPGLRVAYLDIDAHHGDGVQEAFYDRPDVLTISVHESGRYLFPGAGRESEIGTGEGAGFALNVPLPPYADGASYDLVFDEVVTPALAAYRPDVLVAACGADHHHADPLTHLGLNLPEMRGLYQRIVALADEHCGGRLASSGGGGYGTYSVVPRAWTMLLATLAEVDLPEELPEEWRERSSALSGRPAPLTLSEETRPHPSHDPEPILQATRSAVRKVRQLSPLLD